MKLTHVHQTFVEKPVIACPHCGRLLFRSRWVVQLDDKRVCLCEDCVAKVRREADRVFMSKIRGIVTDATKKVIASTKTP